MEVSADDQFKRLRHQIAEAQERMSVHWAYLSKHPNDMHAQEQYAKAAKRHQELRDEVDVLIPPGGK